MSPNTQKKNGKNVAFFKRTEKNGTFRMEKVGWVGKKSATDSSGKILEKNVNMGVGESQGVNILH